MAITPRQIAQLRAALRRLNAAHGATLPTASGKAMEAWVMMRLSRYAQATQRWRVTLRLGDASPLPLGGVFIFPKNQDGIRAANVANPGHIRFENVTDATRRFELHNSLQWCGRSGATHECDLSVLPSSIADTLRRTPGLPKGLPIVAYECKDRAGVADTDEMRQTLARMFDMALITRPYTGSNCRIYEDQSRLPTAWGSYKPKYIPLFYLGAFAIIRAGGFRGGPDSLGGHYHIRRLGQVYGNPKSLNIAMRQFVWALDNVHLM